MQVYNNIYHERIHCLGLDTPALVRGAWFWVVSRMSVVNASLLIQEVHYHLSDGCNHDCCGTAIATSHQNCTLHAYKNGHILIGFCQKQVLNYRTL